MPPERPTPEEAEIQVAMAAGVVSAGEVPELRVEAQQQARGPLELLRQKGRLSDETFASLARDARDVAAPAAPRVEEGPTLVRPSGEQLPPSPWVGPDAPPVAGWDRYQSIRLLGEGGMGRVYLAYDPRLQRNVALKFVKDGGDRELAQRFAFEARAQARIDHPSVGKVYEVGEVDGKPFIAMQYVDGQPLHLAAASLGLERKVVLLRDAARGVNEAHRVGIIHRDLKPSNLMVERSDSEEPRIFVMDFGLARDWSASSTAVGSVLGTPQYMAPEQASGDVANLDRRADVYALGATLYHVLCGEPPIPGTNALEVLRNVFTHEPRPLRQVVPGAPRDLEAVVMKCLEKDRSDRYDSARALADDLDRFLAGEPVRARAYGPWERSRKWLRKHRRAAAVSGAVLAVVLLAVGWGARARFEAARREQLARAFTEKVERIEAGVRYSQLSPLHDTTADLLALEERMKELEAEVARGGEGARGPGEYALGRGALALGDPRRALEHLQAAWDTGFREPRVAYALALVNGQLYREGLEEAERAGGKDVQEAARRDLGRRYRDPALEFLRQSHGAEVPSTEYVSALVAFYEGRLDDALGHLEAIGGGLPWFFEAPLLKAQVLTARASKLAESGDSRRAAEEFERAREAAAAAARIGESEPAVHLARAQVEGAAMRGALLGKGDLQGPFERGMEAAGLALRAAPRSVEALVVQASFSRRLAWHRFGQGANAEELFARAERAAEAARTAAPGRREAAAELAQVLSLWALQHTQQGRDPRELLDRALRLVEEASARGRGYALAVLLGTLHHTRAAYEERIGADSRESRDAAIAAYQAAIQMDERSPRAWGNLGMEYKARASLAGAADADADLRRGAEALDRARALNPESMAIVFHSADLREVMAKRALARGDDPRSFLMDGLQLYREGIALSPELPACHNGAGSALTGLARAEWERGGDPMPHIDGALRAFEQAVALAPAQGFGQYNLGNALIDRARYELALGRDPSASLARAEEALRASLKQIPGRSEPWAGLGTVHTLRAQHALVAGKDPSAHLELADESLRTAVKLSPGYGPAWRSLGEMLATRAEWRVSRSRPSDADFQGAVESFERASQLDPADPRPQLHLARGFRAWGLRRARSGEDPEPLLERARLAAETALRAQPRLAEASALRAAILISLAEFAAPEEGAALLSEARGELEGALRQNHHLAAEWGALAARIGR